MISKAMNECWSDPVIVGALKLRKNCGSHIDASHSRQPLVKGERLVRHEVNAVMLRWHYCHNVQRHIVQCITGYNISTQMMTSHCNDCECCYPKGYAAPSDVPCQCNMRRSPSKLKRTLPQTKIYVTSKSPVGDISVVTLIRTDTTLDHSQEAEKVWKASPACQSMVV